MYFCIFGSWPSMLLKYRVGPFSGVGLSSHLLGEDFFDHCRWGQPTIFWIAVLLSIQFLGNMSWFHTLFLFTEFFLPSPYLKTFVLISYFGYFISLILKLLLYVCHYTGFWAPAGAFCFYKYTAGPSSGLCTVHRHGKSFLYVIVLIFYMKDFIGKILITSICEIF